MQERHITICPVCRSKEWKKRYRIDRWDIDECGLCGFAKIDPMPQPGMRADYYSQEKVEKRNTAQKSGLQKLSRSLKGFFRGLTGRNKSGIFYSKLYRHLKSDAKILDVGCGDGSFLDRAKKNFNCTGIEISAYLASLAGKKGGMKILTGNFFDADFKGNQYDGITLISLLEHLDDPSEAMKKCYTLLNDNGVLLMKTVNYSCLNRVIKGKDWIGFRPPDHMIYFNPSNLKLFLEKIGFKKIKIFAMPFSDNMYCDAWK